MYIYIHIYIYAHIHFYILHFYAYVCIYTHTYTTPEYRASQRQELLPHSLDSGLPIATKQSQDRRISKA